ncbi:MAG: ferritin-like domain-containing protein [Myxococcales bacterium]|nr:ferritin-like domain-containing protein [Myxococcales bacterium]
MTSILQTLAGSGPLLRDAVQSRNLKVLASMLGPAFRGLVQQRGRNEESTPLRLDYSAQFDWRYRRGEREMARLYEAAKASQWNATSDLDWSASVDPESAEHPLIPDAIIPLVNHPAFIRLSPREKGRQRRCLMAWMLSQFLHGEQGALFAAAQVTEAVPWLDAKLFGSTQVVDEGRHVETFHTYLTRKLEKLYEINDNLYVVIDALMTDGRWDLKFLGMQIMIEGLALGAFGFLRGATSEPLLKQMLTYVIADEARHVHYGVLALQKFYATEVSEKERREREDWAFEVAYLLRNRFLAHEYYDEHWAHALSRAEWDRIVLESEMMAVFRRTMFRRIVPNLKRIGLLSDRVRERYSSIGLLQFEHGRAAPDLTAQDLIDDR